MGRHDHTWLKVFHEANVFLHSQYLPGSRYTYCLINPLMTESLSLNLRHERINRQSFHYTGKTGLI